MKIAHFSLWAPRRSGLHEFVIDQITCERRAELDSILINCDEENPDPERFTDRGIVCKPWKNAHECDVWVVHRSVPMKLVPYVRKHGNIAIMHGTAEYMVMLETQTGQQKFDIHISFLERFDKVVAINESDYYIMKMYERGNNLVFIQDSVDLQRFNPDGFKWEYDYRPAIISTANIRFNKTPMSLLWSMSEVIKLIPKARLNIFCIRLTDVSLWRETILKAKNLSIYCENVQLQLRDLRPFLRGADISFNSNINGITSRDTLEAMAMGIPVVSYRGGYTRYHAIVMDPVSIANAIYECWKNINDNPENVFNETLKYAQENFCMDNATKKYLKLYEEVVDISNKRN